MEGEIGPLRELADLCERYDTTLVVDDSHATGVLGKTGRGTAEELGVMDRVPIFTGTLGKAMGSAAGGFTTGPAPVVDLLRQRSRTSLFSNSLPPSVAAASLEAFRMLMEDPSPVLRVQKNALTFRTRMKEAGFRIPEGIHPIAPVIVGDTAKALAMSDALFTRGVYVSGFGFPSCRRATRACDARSRRSTRRRISTKRSRRSSPSEKSSASFRESAEGPGRQTVTLQGSSRHTRKETPALVDGGVKISVIGGAPDPAGHGGRSFSSPALFPPRLARRHGAS